MNVRDAFDTWQASEPAALHNLTIAEIWMAAYDQGRADQLEHDQEVIADLSDRVDAAGV